jgi:hypothetical protein
MQCNLVFLVDASSSMKGKDKSKSSFRKATEAIQIALTNPPATHSEVLLSVILFWDDLRKGFRTETLYESLPLKMITGAQKIVDFGEPPSLAGTRLAEGVDYIVKFLENKQGEKIVKLLTDDTAGAQRVRERNKFRLLEQGIRLDTVIIGQEKGETPKRVVGAGSLGQTFEFSEAGEIAKALLSL